MQSVQALAERLRRQRGHYSQIARTAAISPSWLSMFARGKRGKRPSYELIQRLAATLDAVEADERAARE